MKKLRLAGAMLLLSTFAFSQTKLTGTVRDEQGKPLAGASLMLPKTGQGTASDEQGTYFFENLPPGTYQVQASFVGFDEKTMTIKLAESQPTAKLDFTMAEAANLLEALTVRATRAGDNSPFTYSIIKKEELEANNLGQDIPYLLDAMPSVVVNSDAGAGVGYTGIRIRGTDPTRINVTINGIPINDAESQGMFWVDLPDFASSTEDIQVQRGVGTSTNGAGAFGATINLNSTQFHKNPYGEISGSAGSFGTWKTTAQFGSGLLNKQQTTNNQQPATNNVQRNTGFTFDGRLSRIASDGYIDRASVDLKSFYFSGAYLGKNSSLRANIFSGKEVTYQAWNGVPAQYVNDDKLRRFNVSGTEKSLEAPYDNEVDNYTQTHYQLIFNSEFSPEWQLNLSGHYTRGYGFFEQYKADELPSRYLLPEPVCPDTVGACVFDYVRRRWLDNHFFGGVWSLHFIPSQPLQLTFGGGLHQYLGDHYGEIIWGEYLENAGPDHRYYFGTGNKLDVNVFAKAQYRFAPRLSGFADVQYRRVDYEITGTDNDLRETNLVVDYNFINPKAGLVFDVGENTNTYASFAVANREPNRSDFTDAPKGSQPKPERLFNTEAGIRLNRWGGQFGANFYHMLYKDQLVLTGNINDVGSPIRSNVPDSYRMGIELTGSLPLLPRLSIDANATFSQNKIRNFTEYIDNWDTGGQEVVDHGTTDIAFSPNAVAFGRLNYAVLENNKQQLTLSFAGKHVGRQYIDNTSNDNTVLDAYTVGNFQVRWVLKPAFLQEISFNLLVNNLFDAKYSANAWTYRYISAGYDGRPDDAYTRLEGGNVYNLTGYFPQAGRNFLVGLGVKF
ncbi:MAG: TonB-dependent receptor [Saprospiraceae bacterium]